MAAKTEPGRAPVDLVSRAEFSREAGVSDAAISKWCKGAGAKACHGKRVDRAHPASVAYLASKGAAPTPPPAPAPKSAPAPTTVRPRLPKERPAKREPPPASPVPPSPLADAPEPIGAMEDLTLREITDRYGSATAFKDHLDARKKIVDIREKELKNGELEGTLISRELVKVHVFGAIESSHRRLLADAAKTITQSIYPMARRGDSADDAEAVVRSIISKILDPVKTTAARVLRDG